MSYPPKSIQKMVAGNDVVAGGKAYAKADKTLGTVNKWHEKDTKRLETLSLSGGSPRASDTVGLLTETQAMRDAGVRSGVAQVKLARQARLKELYEREALQYEAELNSLGLALNKPRD